MVKFKFEDDKIVEVRIGRYKFKIGEFVYASRYQRVGMITQFWVNGQGDSVAVHIAYRYRKWREIWLGQVWLRCVSDARELARNKEIVNSKESVKRCFMECWLTWKKEWERYD